MKDKTLKQLKWDLESLENVRFAPEVLKLQREILLKRKPEINRKRKIEFQKIAPKMLRKS